MSYVSRNSVPVSLVPELLTMVHAALTDLKVRTDAGKFAGSHVVQPNASAIRKSIRQNGLVSFIDGGVYQTLKRHLASHGLHARSYRERYGLPEDYPMVSPAYSKRRSVLAKAAGLGTIGNATFTKNRKAAKVH